ncbi:MAG: hypothetical protein JST64_13230 [Actinobacteria bacterium]|nr:hypothetical protein [Actinomycetota bacterium]
MGVGVAAAVLLAGAVVLLDGMDDWAHMVESATPGVRAALFAAEAVGPNRGSQDVILPLSYVPVTNGEYLHGVASVGSPIAGMDPATFRVGRADQTATADRLLVDGLPIRTGTGAGSGPCTMQLPEGPLEVRPGSVVGMRPDVVRSRPDLRPSSGQLTVRVARFSAPARGIEVGVDPLGGADTAWLEVPADAPGVDGADLPYRVTVPAGVAACVVRRR